MTKIQMIPIRYKQLILLPCCIVNSYTNTNVIHIFGRLSSSDHEEELRNACKNTRAGYDWKAKLISDQSYSYLPYTDYSQIDHRKYIYEDWTKELPSSDSSLEETCIFLEDKIRTMKYYTPFLLWMYNVVFYTQHVARTYDELLQDWCSYISIDCPCSELITTLLQEFEKHYNVKYNKNIKFEYIPYDQWLLVDRVNNCNRHIFSKWTIFCKQHVEKSYKYIKANPNVPQALNFMITLATLWEIIDDHWRFITQLFIDDSLHSEVNHLLQEWLNQTGCKLCVSYDLTYVPTIVDIRKNTIIHVEARHSHLRWNVEEKEHFFTKVLHETLETIEKKMYDIPQCAYDSYEIGY